MHQRAEKVVVTGGAGFIGSHLVDRLLAETQAQVVVVDNLQRGRVANLAAHANSDRLNIVQGDVRNPELVAETVRRADVVYHLAAQSTLPGTGDDPDYSFSTNVMTRFGLPRTLPGTD